MPQAETIPTTRRAFSKWLAAVGVIAALPAIVPASASAPEVSTDLLEAAAAIKAALADEEAADAEVERCQEIMGRWLEKNPYPDSSDRKYDTSPDYLTEFHADRREWHTRNMIALRQSGVGRAEQVALWAAAKLDETRYAFLNIVPKTMAELLFMARMARDCDTANGAIAWVVVDNLVEMHSPARTV